MSAIAQSGVCGEARSHASFIAFDWLDGMDSAAARAALAQIPDLASNLAASYPDAGLLSTVAIGAKAWDRVYSEKPSQLVGFPQFAETVIELPVSEIGGLLHIRSERRDLNFELANQIAALLAPLVQWGEQIDGFRYLDSRDLTGFVDGTENPQGEERAQVALVADGDDPVFAGGSFLHVQRWVHNMSKWRETPIDEQERVIGRSKVEDLEMDDEHKLPTAHIARVVIEEEGAELEVLRHSMPYGRIDEMGLFFAAYARSPRPFTLMLQNMFQTDVDGGYDFLLKYSRPVNGAALFAPSIDFLTRMAAS